jgi:hypothetical protein
VRNGYASLSILSIGFGGDIRRRGGRHLAIGTGRVQGNLQVARQFHGVAGHDSDVLCNPGRNTVCHPHGTHLTSEVRVVQFLAVTLYVLGVLVHRVLGLDD